MKLTITFLAVCLAAALESAAQNPETTPAAAPALVPTAAPAPLPTAPPTPRTFFESIRITLDGKAATAGAIGFDVALTGKDPKVVWVRVLPKTAEGAIAEDVAKELTFALGSAYKIKTSGGKITISKANKTAVPISVSIAGLSIYGVSVKAEQY